MNTTINAPHTNDSLQTTFEGPFQMLSKFIESLRGKSIAFQQKIVSAIPKIQVKKGAISTKKYQKSKLTTAQKEQYLNQLLTYLEVEKVYRNPTLTLPDLSVALKISRNYLSQIINEKRKCNFSELINGIRVEEIKKQLQNGENAHYTIVAIAYDAGFNSKSTFYAAFKKYTGMTPSQYRKSMV